MVSRISEDAILRMSFLEEHGCRVNFENTTLHLAGQDLVCNDPYGQRLLSCVQVVNQPGVTPCSKEELAARIATHNHNFLRPEEVRSSPVSIASGVRVVEINGRAADQPTNSAGRVKRMTRPHTPVEESNLEEQQEPTRERELDIGHHKVPRYRERIGATEPGHAATRDGPTNTIETTSSNSGNSPTKRGVGQTVKTWLGRRSEAPAQTAHRLRIRTGIWPDLLYRNGTKPGCAGGVSSYRPYLDRQSCL